MLRIEHIDSRIVKKMKMFLNQEHFEIVNDTHFKFENEFIKDDIYIRVVKLGFDFGVIPSISRKYKLIEKYWEDLKDQYNVPTGDETTISLYRNMIVPNVEDNKGYNLLKGGGLYIKSSDIDNELSKFTETYINEYYQYFSPFLKETQNIHWLDSKINMIPFEIAEARKIFPSRFILIEKVIIAKLSGNSNYENIYETSFELLEKHVTSTGSEDSKKKLEILRIVYDRLKDVPALENPVLV